MGEFFMPNRAFTLIELMVTFAIVAALAIIGVPAYSKYRVRTKVATMFAAAGAAQFAVANDYYNQGYTFSTIAYANNSQPFTTPQSSAISSIAISAGIITVTGNSADLGGRTINLIFTPSITNNDITWACATSSSTYFEFVPLSCQH